MNTQRTSARQLSTQHRAARERTPLHAHHHKPRGPKHGRARDFTPIRQHSTRKCKDSLQPLIPNSRTQATHPTIGHNPVKPSACTRTQTNNHQELHPPHRTQLGADMNNPRPSHSFTPRPDRRTHSDDSLARHRGPRLDSMPLRGDGPPRHRHNSPLTQPPTDQPSRV